MIQSKQEVAERVTQAISRSTNMAELWQRLGILATSSGQSTAILNGWLDGFLERLGSEYVSGDEHWDVAAIRDLALDQGEAVSEAAMELLLERGQDAIDEIVAILWGKRGNAAESKPGLRIKKLYADARMPQRATEGASGLDLFAYIKEQGGGVPLEEKPKLIGTGVAVEVPSGYDVQIRPRSGLSAKGIMVAFGTVDSDYRGELMVTVYALGRGSGLAVKHGDRIAQLVIGKLAELPIEQVEELSPTERGRRGHGSTGMI